MKFTIVIPVYNVEKYLKECLDSAVNQNFSDFEIIAVNDGSTDNSLNILKKYEKKYENFKVIDQINQGLSGARNTGLKAAKGKYIYFLDSDDYISLETLRISYENCEKYSLDILTFDAQCFLDIDDENQIENMDIVSKENYDRKSALESKVLEGQDFYNYIIKANAYKQPIWLYVYRTEFLIENKLYFYHGLIHEDELYTVQALINAKNVLYIPRSLFFRRLRFNSIMTSKIRKKNIDSLNIICKELYTLYLEKHNSLKDETNINLIRKIREFYTISLFRMYDNNLTKNEVKECRQDLIKNLQEAKKIKSKKLMLQLNFPRIYIKLYKKLK